MAADDDWDPRSDSGDEVESDALAPSGSKDSKTDLPDQLETSASSPCALGATGNETPPSRPQSRSRFDAQLLKHVFVFGA